ncbi:YopJ/AvrA family T3SS effector serine/threonine acetyltransferase [Bartonella gliris]|uniref:YopJ/AvrA family T3SS effector serine/threonine acetyltransferase n=1 Tax=Bartonella gliris TaxID=3004109 RepID=UPI00295F312A|nr:YopJ/AvrA family T3SS effector serine/threonine acetyltransferase [Bartonella gliris]
MPKSKDQINQASGPLKEDDIANEPLESLLARLEAITPEKKTSLMFSNQSLKSIIADLEQDIANGSFTNKNYVYTDLTMMSALVEKANDRHVAMNIQLAMPPQSLVETIKKTVDSGAESARFLISAEGEGAHFSVIDYRDFSSRKSLILFETTNFRNPAAQMLAVMSKSAIEDSQLPSCYFSMAEMNIQKHSSGSGIVSLALAKKLYLEYPKLLRMHIDNINGDLCKEGVPLSSDKVDRYLPTSFYKHAYRERRIRQYVKENPEALHEIVNKKGENLLERARKNLTLVVGEHFSVSTHKKRIQEYKSLMR